YAWDPITMESDALVSSPLSSNGSESAPQEVSTRAAVAMVNKMVRKGFTRYELIPLYRTVGEWLAATDYQRPASEVWNRAAKGGRPLGVANRGLGPRRPPGTGPTPRTIRQAPGAPGR